jgi:hypothetical protein
MSWTEAGYRPEDLGRGVLLLGNGLNWAVHGPDWFELLQDVAHDFQYPGDLDTGTPFPMLYEEVFLHSRRAGVPEGEILQRVAEHSETLAVTSLSSRLGTLPVSHLLTTNYDAATYESFLGLGRMANAAPVQESRYSLFRRLEVAERVVWPIHGQANIPGSIMLGYEHYGGYLEQMRRYVTRGVRYQGLSQQSLIKTLSGGFDLVRSWVDFFFLCRVVILGFGLDLQESHLWWLLTYRARNMAEGKSSMGGEIIYLSRPPSQERDPARKEALERKHRLLLAAGATVEMIAESDPADRTVHFNAALDMADSLLGSS